MIQTEFFDYQRLDPPWGIGGRCSPALQALRIDLEARWQVTSSGCFGVRPVRLGERPSTHSFGAAIDIDFRTATPEAREQMCGYLVAWSAEWGVQAVHDYQRCRIWRAGRTTNPADACSRWWKAQRPDSAGMGKLWATWLHVEVHPDRWLDDRLAAERGIE